MGEHRGATAHIIPLSLRELEESADFRAGYLYYLQLANSYIASIFWHCFPDGDRKKKLYAQVRAYDDRRKKENGPDFDKQLKSSLMPVEGAPKSPYLECYKEDFARFLRDGLSGERKDALARRLKQDHAIPLGYDGFCDAIDLLRRKRNYLKDWRNRKDKQNRPDDAEVIEMLGLFLLPKLHQHFQGMAERHRRRLRRDGRETGMDMRSLRAIFARAKRRRREGTEQQYAHHRSRQTLTRAQRKDLEQNKLAWQKRYGDFYPPDAWPRYNLFQFQIRYHFMGKSNIAHLDKAMRDASRAGPDRRLHFQWELEAAYETAMRINARLAAAFRLIEVAETKKIKKSGQAVLKDDLREIRNGISHNVLFSALPAEGGPLPVRTVFATVFDAFRADHVVQRHGDPAGHVGDLYSFLRDLLDGQDYVLAIRLDPESGEPDRSSPHVIRRWDRETRQKYGVRNCWKIDRRRPARALMAAWRRDLDSAFECFRAKGHGEKCRKN